METTLINIVVFWSKFKLNRSVNFLFQYFSPWNSLGHYSFKGKVTKLQVHLVSLNKKYNLALLRKYVAPPFGIATKVLLKHLLFDANKIDVKTKAAIRHVTSAYYECRLSCDVEGGCCYRGMQVFLNSITRFYFIRNCFRRNRFVRNPQDNVRNQNV